MYDDLYIYPAWILHLIVSNMIISENMHLNMK